MLLAFRSKKEVDRAKTLCESRGIRVADAIAYQDVAETEAAAFVKQVEHEDMRLFCNYTNHCTDGLCATAKASLGTALSYVNAINGIDGEYLLIYEKEAPFLQVPAQESQPGATVA